MIILAYSDQRSCAIRPAVPKVSGHHSYSIYITVNNLTAIMTAMPVDIEEDEIKSVWTQSL